MSSDSHTPSILQQRLKEVEDERCTLSPAFGLSKYEDGSLRTGKYLYDCEGKCKYFVVAIEEYLLLYNNEPVCGEPRKRVEYSFGKDARIHDCAFMYLEDNSEGLVVGVTTVDETGVRSYCLYLLSAEREPLILDAIIFGRDCKKVFVVYDELHRDDLKRLDPAFHKYPHLIVVGMEAGSAYLTHFENTSKGNALRDHPPRRPVAYINALRQSRNIEKKLFNFSTSRENVVLKLSDVEVTSIGYIHRCHCLLLGFNFGGIYCINLETQATCKVRVPRGEIKAMQIQEPDDDPRPQSYIWIASLTKEFLSFTLLALNFYTDPSDPSIVDLNTMFLSEKLNFEAEKYCHFLSLKTVTRERTLKPDNTTRVDDIQKKDTTLMLFSWLNLAREGSTLEGALFDLNMYYYKRMVNRIRGDGTYANQCPLLSRFSMVFPNGVKFAALLDIHLNPESLYRGKSDLIENVDQFFYPSTYGFELHTFNKECATVLCCKPIQFQFFEHLSPLKVKLHEPDMAMRCLTALGFIPLKEANMMTNTADKCSFILSTLLHNYSGNLIIQMIKDETVSEKHLTPLVDWLYTEIQKCVDHFQRITSKLFEENSEELYSAQITKVNHYIGVFEMIKEIIVMMKSRDLSDEIHGQLYVKMVVVDTFLFYSRLMNVFVEVGLFPITPEVIELHKALDDFHRERTLLSRRKLYKLEIDKLLDLFSKTDLDCIENLYPPKNPAVLIDLIVAPEIKITGKLRLISYYALDIGHLRNNDTFIDKVQYNVAFFFTERNSIDFFEMKNIWRQDSIELEHYKENIYAIRHDNLDCDYKNHLTPRVVERLCQRVFISDDELKDLHNYLLKQPYGLFIWNYIAVKREEFSMIEPLNINVLSNIPEEWKIFCETSKNLYEEAKGNSIIWRYKMPSLFNKKNGLKSGNSFNITNSHTHDKTQAENEQVIQDRTKDNDTIVDQDYMDHQSVGQRYENLLKTPLSASRWIRVSRISNINNSPDVVQSKEIQPTSIMKSRERVSRLRPGMKIGSRIRFNLPELSSVTDNTVVDSICSAENNDLMNSSFTGVFHIEKSDEKTELDDVKCVYETIIKEKIEEQMSKTVRYEEGKVTVMETQTDEEMLLSDLENSPAKTGTDLINHMEERSKSYNIDLPAVVIVQSSEEVEKEVITIEESTPVLKRRKSCVIQKTLSFTENKISLPSEQEDKTNRLKRNSPCEDMDFDDDYDAKKTKVSDDIDENEPDADVSNLLLRRSARIRNQSVEPEIQSVPTLKSKTKCKTPSRENSVESDSSSTTKTRSKRGGGSREPSLEPEVSSTTKTRSKRGGASREASLEPEAASTTKSRSKRGGASREASLEPEATSTTKTRGKRGGASRETSVEPEVPSTPKSRTRRGSSCEQDTELRRSARLRRTPSKEFESNAKKGPKSPSRLPTIQETNIPNL